MKALCLKWTIQQIQTSHTSNDERKSLEKFLETLVRRLTKFCGKSRTGRQVTASHRNGTTGSMNTTGNQLLTGGPPHLGYVTTANHPIRSLSCGLSQRVNSLVQNVSSLRANTATLSSSAPYSVIRIFYDENSNAKKTAM